METPTGSVNTGIMDFNNALGGGASYAAKHTNWKTEGIDLDSWNEHNRDYYNNEKISAEISSTKVPRSLISLTRNEFGEPILPNPPHCAYPPNWEDMAPRFGPRVLDLSLL